MKHEWDIQQVSPTVSTYLDTYIHSARKYPVSEAKFAQLSCTLRSEETETRISYLAALLAG